MEAINLNNNLYVKIGYPIVAFSIIIEVSFMKETMVVIICVKHYLRWSLINMI